MLNEGRRGVEQLAARRAHNPKVTGSSPVPATKTFNNNVCTLYDRRPLAQLVEHLTFNQRVEGSSPSWLIISISYTVRIKILKHIAEVVQW